MAQQLYRWKLWWLLLVGYSWKPSSAFFFFLFAGKCAKSKDRCFFGFFYSMYNGLPGTAQCKQICTLPIFVPGEWKCGVCNPPASAPTSAPMTGGEDFFIDLDLADVPLADRSFYYRKAAETWTDIVTEGLPDVATSQIPVNLLPAAPCTLPSGGVIDDLYICIEIKKFDKKNENVVASAAPVFARSGGAGGALLPITGFLSVNEDKINQLKDDGIYQDVIRHEIAHVLGFGTLWGRDGLVSGGSGGTDCSYVGSKAVQEYRTLSGCTRDIPLDGCGHWDEICFGDELLTDTIGTNAVLSRISIAALADLGYKVDYTKADTFTKYDLAFTCRCGIRLLNEDGSVLHENHSHQLPRRLSDEGYESAYKYGQSLLDEQNELINSLGGRADLPTGIDFVADRAVNVLYMEAGTVFSVTVVREDPVE